MILQSARVDLHVPVLTHTSIYKPSAETTEQAKEQTRGEGLAGHPFFSSGRDKDLLSARGISIPGWAALAAVGASAAQ
jgi:hypothetical protein